MEVGVRTEYSPRAHRELQDCTQKAGVGVLLLEGGLQCGSDRGLCLCSPSILTNGLGDISGICRLVVQTCCVKGYIVSFSGCVSCVVSDAEVQKQPWTIT
jgi:hypothetical protein